MKILNCIAAFALIATLGAGQASAEPKPMPALSPYLGQCVALVITIDEVLPGTLVAVEATYLELDVQGIHVIVFTSQITHAVPDPTGELDLCATETVSPIGGLLNPGTGEP